MEHRDGVYDEVETISSDIEAGVTQAETQHFHGKRKGKGKAKGKSCVFHRQQSVPQWMLPSTELEVHGSGKPRYILPGGMSVCLSSLYDTGTDSGGRELSVYVKKGNVRRESGHIMINLQKQLQELGITFKPMATHMTIGTFHPGVEEYEADALTKAVADEIGDKIQILVLRKCWGPHSVLVSGPFVEHIQRAIKNAGEERLDSTLTPHVELIPRLRDGEVYVEATSESLSDLRVQRPFFSKRKLHRASSTNSNG